MIPNDHRVTGKAKGSPVFPVMLGSPTFLGRHCVLITVVGYPLPSRLLDAWAVMLDMNTNIIAIPSNSSSLVRWD